MKQSMVILLLFFLVSGEAFAAPLNAVMVAPYSTMKTGATAAQENPLKTVVLITYPKQVTTVGEALHVLLLGSGYSLDPFNQQEPVVKNLFSQPLPVVDRHLGPITVADGVTTLIGAAYAYRVNPVTRRLLFSLKPACQKDWLLSTVQPGALHVKP